MPPLTVKSTDGQGSAKGVPKMKQATASGDLGQPLYIEMVNRVPNTLQGTDNGLATLHWSQGCLEPCSRGDYCRRR